jgi:hypothetical protein
VKIGESTQPSGSFEIALASDPGDSEDLFFFFEDLFRELRLFECLDRERPGLLTLVWSVYDCSGMLSLVAPRVEVKVLVTEKRPRTPAAISSASF